MNGSLLTSFNNNLQYAANPYSKTVKWVHRSKNIDSKEQILEVAGELALKFLSYDREDDEDLSEDIVLTAIESGLVTVDEIVESFRETLLDSLPDE